MAIDQHLMAKLGLDTRQFDRELRRAVQGASKANTDMGRAWQQGARNVAAVTAAVAAATTALGEMAERGSKVNAVQRGFERSTRGNTQAIGLLRTATLGLVSDYDLMVQANQALTLGSAKTADEVAELASVATRLGRALGLDVQFALNSLNTGIARQSRLLLDNLGIIVDVAAANQKYADSLGVATSQLSEADKAEAFRIEAMRQATAAADRLGDTVSSAGEAWGQFKTEASNAFDALATSVNESGPVTLFFQGLTELMRTARGEGEGFLSVFNRIGLAVAGFGPGAFSPVDRTSGPPQGSSPSQPFGLPGLTVTGSRTRRVPTPFGITPRTLSPFELLSGQQLTGPSLGGFGFLGDLPEDPLADLEVRAPSISKDMQRISEANRHAQELARNIIVVGNVVENVLVKSLTRAVMRFESISELVKDIGRSLLSSVIGGLVSFGMNALQTAALSAIGIPAPLAAAGAIGGGKAGYMTAKGGFTIDPSMIPEPADRGIIASKSQVQRLVVEVIRDARRNGADI